MNENLIEKGRKIKLVVSDIDGTLLNRDRRITLSNLEAVRKAREQNILFTICTGRIPTMADYYRKELQLDIPMITANGAVIWDPKLGMPSYDIPMKPEDVTAVLELCQAYRLDYSALTLGTSYFSRNSIRIRRFQEYNRIAGSNGMPRMQLEFFDHGHRCVRDKKVYKILIYDPMPERLGMIRDDIMKLGGAGCTASEPGLLDVSEARVNKGFGIQKLTELLGLKPKEVCAVGDYTNDIPMLDYAGFPVAMGNACDELKEHAVYVTKTNEESGVAWLLEQFILTSP